MGQNILHCIVWKNTKESEHLTQIPKPHLSTFLIKSKYICGFVSGSTCNIGSLKLRRCGGIAC